ncbi:hypothetical protein BDW74DRAFT_156985 [Aspergillus multicolor]|uniref:uncharacterized protein n=1 Tax=Aspergillus multicolor TaxID=41759 RepID=UPI003CCD23F1
MLFLVPWTLMCEASTSYAVHVVLIRDLAPAACSTCSLTFASQTRAPYKTLGFDHRFPCLRVLYRRETAGFVNALASQSDIVYPDSEQVKPLVLILR